MQATIQKAISFLLAATMLLSLGGVAYAETLTLPASTRTIEEEAFAGDSSLDEVVVPEGATSIGKRAFADSGLKRIDIPGTVTEIADDAFDGVSDLTIHALAGTYAVDYARAHRITLDSNLDPGVTATASAVGYTREDREYSRNNYWKYRVPIGESITFTIDAMAEIGKLHYIWSVDGVPDAEATGCEYSLTADHFHAVEGSVSDDYGNSVLFTFDVCPDTNLTAHTQNYQSRYLVAAGQTQKLYVLTDCDFEPLTYQWYRMERQGDSIEYRKIDGATQATYETAPVNGYTEYEFRVTDIYGNMESVRMEVSIDSHLRVNRVGDNGYQVYAPGPGEPVTMAVEASCDVPVSYQWYQLEYDNPTLPGYDRIPISGATGTSYTTGPVERHTNYGCEITDAYGSSEFLSFDVVIDTNLSASAPNGSTSSSVSVAAGEPAELTVTASCDVPVSYQWYEQIPIYDSHGNLIGATIACIDGATEASFTVPRVDGAKNYYCSVSDIYNNGVNVWFNISVDTHLSAYAQNYNTWIPVAPHEDATMTVVASCDTPVTYQWYEQIERRDSDGNWISSREKYIEGATSDTYTASQINGNKIYRCVISDSYGQTSTVMFNVSVETHLSAYAKDNQREVRVPYGTPAELTVVASCDEPLSYQWKKAQRIYSGGYYDTIYVPIDGETQATYTVPAVNTLEYYTCQVSDPYGNSTAVYFDVYVETHLSAQASGNKTDFAVEPGESSVLTVEASCDAALSYQWRVMVPTYDEYGIERMTEDMPIEGATGASYTTPPAVDGRDYHCVVSDPYGSSRVIYFYMSIPTNLSVRAKNTSTYFSLTAGETAQLNVEVSCDVPVTIQWFSVDTNTWSSHPIEGATGESYTIEPMTKSAKYTCQVVDAYHNHQSITFEIDLKK